MNGKIFQSLSGLPYVSPYAGLSSGIDDLHLDSNLSLTAASDVICDATDMVTLSREIEKER